MASFLRQRRNPEPDVPEDVAFLHLNDPNWDPPTSASYSEDGFSVSEAKGQTYSSGFSTRNSDIDSVSHADRESSYKATESRYHLSEVGDDFNDDSPYAEVRASVSNIDDPSMPVNTFRMWFLGILVTILMSGINHVMSLRYPSVGVNALVVQLVTLPLGRAMQYLPRTKFNTFGYVWSLNPGPFNAKEHTVIVAMSNVLYTDSFATLVYAVQEMFYGSELSAAYKVLLVLSTQLVGFAFTGLIRQFLVFPPSMIWPSALVQCALLNTLHKNYDKKEGSHMSRMKFFTIVTLVGGIYYFLPGYLFTGLSMFTWACWIAPENQIVNTLFGFNTGLGMGFLTFDWSMISYVTNPLISPWWAEVNIFAGFAFFMWFLAPIFYYRNVFFSKFMPISAAAAFDNTGMQYDTSQILTNNTFDEAKYKAYSPLYLPATFWLSYGAQFAALTCVVTHTLLWYRRDIIRQCRRNVQDERDVHSRLMSVYRDIPLWWYGLLGVISFAFAVAAIHVFPTELPVWGILVALVLMAVFAIPTGILRAQTNQLVSFSVFAELVAGYIFPNRPVAVLLFKTYSYGSMNQALNFAGDLKLGHYMKVPPRIMFMGQLVSTIIGSLVMYGTQEWIFSSVANVCTPEAKAGFSCPPINTVATSSLIWGAIGPQRIFSQGALYWPIMIFFLIGAVAPIPFYLLAKKYPTGIWRYVNMPLFFTSTGIMPPASGINFSSWIMVGAIFEWFMRRFHFRWWMRYNYILAAALDSGVILSAIVIFCTLLLPKGGINLNWWGNTVWMNTFDAQGVPAAIPNPTFGLATW
ncbi:hypothetical protein EUX98_g4449 [Antrodiella citrinella]|uniref:OPT family small oligopeptide transporter n=1 Tax=Antrodiella citrinella TaxID=2447956 RepID=A0A4S4MWR6_9APHY|nr:hypothetical protein EUX98_g4449 [Antrodiella citrinella]